MPCRGQAELRCGFVDTEGLLKPACFYLSHCLFREGPLIIQESRGLPVVVYFLKEYIQIN